MNSKTLLQLCGAAVIAMLPLSTLSAQPKNMPGIDERLDKMKTNLALTDDQVTQLKAIFEEQKAAADPIWQDKTLSKEERREKMKPIKDATKSKVDAVLTPEQQAKMKAMRKDKKGD